MREQTSERAPEIFAVALRLRAEERAAYVGSACGPDAAMRDEILSLLDRHVQETAFEAAAAAPGGLCGASIGNYRLYEVIGAGGMGVVYRAEQQHPRREVAIKVLRPGHGSATRRFEREVQLLAMLEHPCIARLYEAGTADLGAGPQAYLAMELVRGKPLTGFAEERALSVAERLALVAAVADAVQFAHQKGIIHRDLKPGNILVDAAGVPHVLDFGVARALHADNEASTLHTEHGQVLGTLAYMSPEQVMDAAAADTRSDVYALGVILYELLAGRRPIDVAGRSLPDAARAVREEEPRRLGAIDRRLRGDVEVIAAKALEKDPSRRYASAAALAEDIRRFLASEPILARPASALYVTGRMLRRHRAAAIAGAVVLGALVVFGAVAAVQARRNAVLAASERAINSFLFQALASMRPDQLGHDVRMRAVLDDAARRIEAGELRRVPLVEASVRTIVGVSYQSLGLYAEAQSHLDAAYAARESRLGLRHADTLEVLLALARNASGQGQYAQAEQIYRRALEIQRRRLPANSPDLAAAMRHVGATVAARGDATEATPLLQEALRIYERAGREHRADAATCIQWLAVLDLMHGRLDAAEVSTRRALEIRKACFGERNVEVVDSQAYLVRVLHAQGRLDEAEALSRASIETRRGLQGPEHPRMATAIDELAAVLRDKGEFDEAERLCRDALNLRRRLKGDDNHDVAVSWRNLGLLLCMRGRLEESEAAYREALRIDRAALVPDHIELAEVLQGLAETLRAAGRAAEAEPLSSEAEAIRARQQRP